MYSIIFATCDQEIELLGPFESQQEALDAATKAHEEGDFDAEDQEVYLLGPHHSLDALEMKTTLHIKKE